MPKIQITAQIESALAAMAGDQAPFVTSVALNRTAVGARDKVRDGLPTKFKLRNQWTMRGIQAKASTKANLVAEVLAPGYMEIQETGGERKPSSPEQTLKAPGKALQTGGIIPKGKRPKAMLADRAFIIHMPGSDAGVFLRYGKKRGQIKLLWWLSDVQDYEDRFGFERDVDEHVRHAFSANFVAAMEEALQRGAYAARPKGGDTITNTGNRKQSAYRLRQARSGQ